MALIKWPFLAALLLLLVAGVVFFVITRIEIAQAHDADKRMARLGKAVDVKSDNAVVYFSRSGNTAMAATHVAHKLGARVFKLKTSNYQLGIRGLFKSAIDARNHEADVVLDGIDLNGVKTLYIGAPIWMYSPAPPIWEFARRTRLDGMDVVLFNTFNSKFEQRFIDEFERVAMAQGAKSFRHVFVKRGRMTQQLSTDEMLQTIDDEWMLTE